MPSIVTTVKEARGAITAHSGSTNEHFTNRFLNIYYDDLEQRLLKGDTIKAAHKKALVKLKSKPYDRSYVRQTADLLVAHKILGEAEMQTIHEDSKKTATGVAEHIVKQYASYITSAVHVGKSGPKVVEQITGLPSQADIIVETNMTNQPLEYLKHKGLSLKYSKAKGTSIKIHSPTIKTMGNIIDDHYAATFGKKMGLQDELLKFSKTGLIEQQAALIPYHNTLEKFFRDLDDSRKSYTKLVDGYGNHIGGDLSKPATSHLRDSDSEELRKIYEAIALANLTMKRSMAKALFDGIDSVFKNNPGQDLGIKESLLRSIANVQSAEKLTQLPTMIISTDRDKGVHIFDVNHYLELYIKLHGVEHATYTKGASGFKVGPLSVFMDARPTTNMNPIAYPINVAMSGSNLKKESGQELVK